MRITEEDLHLASLLPGGTKTEFNPWLTLSGQVIPLLGYLRDAFGISCPFFLLFDDFDVLSADQQMTVFKTAANRKLDVVCFKFGIMTHGRKSDMAGRERTFREGDDYDLVGLDWTDEGSRSKYSTAVELITAKRLRLAHWPEGTKFSDLLSAWEHGETLRDEVRTAMREEYEKLPDGDKPQTFDNFFAKYGNAQYFQYLAMKKIHHNYAGYDTIIDISSGIYRQYLEACSRIVASALGSGWSPFSGIPISARDQDKAIREYSRDMISSLSKTAGDASALLTGGIEITSYQMTRFLDSLSRLFRARLHSQHGEPEIFSISIRDNISGNEKALAILKVAERESILQRRSSDYTSKAGTGNPLPTYMLNRRLAPRLGLGLRMQGRIELTASDVVLAATNTEEFLKKHLGDDLGQSTLDEI